MRAVLQHLEAVVNVVWCHAHWGHVLMVAVRAGASQQRGCSEKLLVVGRVHGH